MGIFKMVNIRQIDLNLLVIFDVLLTELNVSKAAARIGLSQSAMSNALNRLRESLGDPLFTPSARGMVATQRALELERPVREALTALYGALNSKTAFDPDKSEHVFS